MNIYTLTTEDFQKTNKALSQALGVDYVEIHVENVSFEYIRCGYGGKTIGTTGFKFSEESKKKMSESRKGKQTWLGKTHTEETKRKISEFKLGTKLSEETKKKMSITRQSKKFKHTEESKQKMRELALKREELKRQALGN